METQDDEDDEISEREHLGLEVTPHEVQLAEAMRAGKFPGLMSMSTIDRDDAEVPSTQLAVNRLGRYAVLRELGRGGMGVVYACYDEQLERKVAVKLLRARFHQETARKRLEREAQALARLSHPNVVQIYEIGDHHGELFLAMEFVVGQTLRDWLYADGREAGVTRSWREVATLLREIGAGLAAAHEVGLVHRDFKPDNVMVGDDGRPRILDFGLVRHLAAEDELATVEEVGEEVEARAPRSAWRRRICRR